MNWIQQFKQRVEQENPQPERQGKSKDPAAAVNNSTPSSVATDRPEVSERTPTEPSQEREPGEDEEGIAGEWPPKSWSLANWLKGAKGNFHVRSTLTGDQPIARGFSWKD